jgi:hypothetical protein
MAKTETTQRRRRPSQGKGIGAFFNVSHSPLKNPSHELPKKRVSQISDTSEAFHPKGKENSDLNRNINIRVEECESRDSNIDEIKTSKANKIIRNYQEEIRL